MLLGGAARAARAQGNVPRDFTDVLVVGGLDFPVGIAFLPDGRLLVTEQFSGDIRLIVNGALSVTDPVGTVGPLANQGGEQGLLGIAVDPFWPARPYIYVHWDHDGDNRIYISRFTLNGDRAGTGNGALTLDAASRYDLLTDPPDFASNHNGGTVRFGLDNMLYVSLGDDANRCQAQDSVSLAGVILRLDVSQLPAAPGGPAPKSLITPADNPFVSHANENARLVWALGLRNPFRFHVVHGLNSELLFIADVGEVRYEEISFAEGPGRNLGWPWYEGSTLHGQCPGLSNANLTAPIYVNNRQGTTAAIISADYFISRFPSPPSAFPNEYAGDYFFSDYYQGYLRRLEGSGQTWSIAAPVPGQPNATDWGTGFREVSDYLFGPDGALWYCKQANNFSGNTGAIRRIVHTQGGPPPPPPPSGRASFTPPYPSPARGGATFTFNLPSSLRTSLIVYNALGQTVRELIPVSLQPSGPQDIFWDGKDDDGHIVPPGLYFVRLNAGSQELVHRFPLIP